MMEEKKPDFVKKASLSLTIIIRNDSVTSNNACKGAK